MRLLIVTQVVDQNDSVLGFFHRWIEEFSKYFEKITVICLEKGEYHLPPNVLVLSLGKETKKSRLSYLINFYKYLFSIREYDSVFIHMNQEYVLLGGLFWKLTGKKILLWRNHLMGNFLTTVAVWFSDRVFCTSPRSFTAKFKKTQLMPVGIDTDYFKPDFSQPQKSNSILFLGRIAPVKNVEAFVDMLTALKKNVPFSATIAGGALPEDSKYENYIHTKVKENNLSDSVYFAGAVKQEKARELYRQHKFYVNFTASGSMDKAIFEALACGMIPLVYNQELIEDLGKDHVVENLNPKETAKKMLDLMQAKDATFRQYVIENHNLQKLKEQLMTFVNIET